MSKKKLLTLFIIFILLIIVATYSVWSIHLPFFQKSTITSEIDFSTYSEETVDKIVIAKKGEDEKVIIKDGGVWKISGFIASSKAIDDFFEALKKVKVESIVSKNPENYSNFGVDEDAYLLALTKGKQTSTFLIGNQGLSFNSFYAREKNGMNVYLFSGAILDKLSQTVSDLRDKTIVNIPKETIQKIDIVSKIAPLTITKTKDEKWQAEGSGKTALLDDAIANNLLAAFNPLEANGFLNEDQSKEFDKSINKTILRIYDNNQKLLSEIILLKKENDYWVQVAGREIHYKMATYKLSNILLSYDEIFKSF